MLDIRECIKILLIPSEPFVVLSFFVCFVFAFGNIGHCGLVLINNHNKNSKIMLSHKPRRILSLLLVLCFFWFPSLPFHLSPFLSKIGRAHV